MFPLTNSEINISKQSNSPLQSSKIIDSIELFFITKSKLKIPNLVKYICLYIAGIISDKIYIENQFELLQQLISSLKFFIKKYTNFLFIVLISIINKKKERKINIDKELELYSLLFEVIIQNNIIPNKEMHSYIKELNEYKTTSSIIHRLNKDSIEIPYKLELIGNFTKNSEKNPKFIMKILNKSKISEDLSFKSSVKDITICPIIQITFENKSTKNNIYTPLKLYNRCMKIVNDYMNHEEIEKNEIRAIIVNLLFYINFSDEISTFPTKFLVFYLYMMTSIE